MCSRCSCVSPPTRQVNRSIESRKEGEMWKIGLHGVLHLGGILLVDVLFHFLYILSIPMDMKLLKHLSDWAVGLWNSISTH